MDDGATVRVQEVVADAVEPSYEEGSTYSLNVPIDVNVYWTDGTTSDGSGAELTSTSPYIAVNPSSMSVTVATGGEDGEGWEGGVEVKIIDDCAMPVIIKSVLITLSIRFSAYEYTGMNQGWVFDQCLWRATCTGTCSTSGYVSVKVHGYEQCFDPGNPYLQCSDLLVAGNTCWRKMLCTNTPSGILHVNELYRCRRPPRYVEIIDGFVAPGGAERVVEHRRATFSREGELETEIEVGLSGRDPLSRIEREFQHGQCVLETLTNSDGTIPRRRRIILDARGRAIEEVIEDAHGRRRTAKVIHYRDDGSRVEEMPLESTGEGHYQIAGMHFPVRDAAIMRVHYDERSLLARAQFIGHDGASRGEVVIDYDTGGRRHSIRHYAGGGIEYPISEVRFEYDDVERIATRTTIVMGEVVERSTRNDVVEPPPADELAFEDDVNESGDWVERRWSETRRVIRRTIEYW